MTDEQFIELTYYLERIASAAEVLATAADPKYDGLVAAGNKRAEAKRELNAKQKPKNVEAEWR
jgi:hypothetical protein